MEISNEIIKIQPKTNYLSPLELTLLRNAECDVPGVGLKKTVPANSEEEKLELEKLYVQLEKQLSMPRIERLAGRALAEWDPFEKAVIVKRKDGKFETFGYTVDGKLYLEYYEALFLLEVNRLQLECNSRILSIEQAYLLLMEEQKSKKFNEYLVYSHFTRVGYILVRHQNKHYPKHNIDSAEDCIWAILDAELEGDNIPDYVRKSKFYVETQKEFDIIKNSIINQKRTGYEELKENEYENPSINFSKKLTPSRKRKAEDSENNWHKAKRRRNYATFQNQNSLVDFLKHEEEYKKFKKQFEKFDIIPMKIYEEVEIESNEDITLPINFDVYMHNEGFRKSSPQLPNFRVIILDSEERFPTHKEIYFTHRKQLNAVPLLLVTVNDSKQIHAFLYYFS